MNEFPWEDYASGSTALAESDGPWNDYAPAEETPAPASRALELKPGEQYFYEQPAMAGGTAGPPSLEPNPFEFKQTLLGGLPETIQKAADVGIGALPELLQTPAKIAAAMPLAVDKTAIGIMDWALTPKGATQLMAAGIPATRIPMAMKFFYDMAKGGGESASSMIDAWKAGDYQGFADALVGTLANAAGAFALGYAGAKPIRAKLKTPEVQGPIPTEEILQTPRGALPPETTIEKGVPNASQVTSPERILGPQVRAGMDETTPLRQPGETPGTRPPEAEAQAPGVPEALAEPSPVEKLAAEIAFQKPKAPTTLADIESGKAVGTESAMAALVDELRQTKDPVSVIQKWAQARDKASAESASAIEAAQSAKDVPAAVRKINGSSLKSQLISEAIQNVARFGEKEFSPEIVAAAKQHFNKGSTLKPTEIPNEVIPQPQVPQAQTPPPQLPRPEPAVAVRPPAPVPAAEKATELDRKFLVDRLNEIKPELQNLSSKGGLTKSESERFRALSYEANTLRFQLSKPLDLSKIPSPAKRQSKIASETILVARNELLKNKDIYDPIVDAASGVRYNAETAVDDIMRGKNSKVSAQQFYDAFSLTREALRNQFGNTIKLFRAIGKQKEKPTTNWATTRQYAKQFGDNVISKEIPIDDIIAVNVGISGKYEELIVGKRPSETIHGPMVAPGALPAPTPAALKVEAPDMGIPTLKNPIKAFGKSYYKNASGEWRQKGKPSATVNVSTRNALDEILNPPSSVSGSVPAEVAQGSVSLGTQKLMPAPGAGNVLTPKSQRQIITDLAKGLKLPIRFGRLTTTKYAGYFKPLANLIGSKRANDVPTVSHEVGHKLDALFSLSGDKTIAAELDRLGDPATPGSMSSWTPAKTKKYKIAEGLAEFVRHWITDPARAAKESPNTHRAFEAIMDANKDVGDVMRRAQEDVQLWRTAQPQARLRSQISIGDNPNKTPYTLSQLTRDLVDDLHIMRLAVDDAKVNAGKELPPSQNPYLLARNLRGSYGMAETFIRNGTADFATRKVELGKSFEDALKPVAGRINDFRDWIVAKRAKELMRQGRETGLVESDVDAVIARFEKDPAFQKAFDSVKQWNAAVLKYAVDSGLLSPDSAAAMSKLNQDYVPFHRLFEVGAGESPSQAPAGIGQGLNVGKPGSLKRLRGSPRQIVDPLETMIKNAYTIITASEKAAINQAVADMASLPNMGKWIERIAQPKENIRLEIDDIKRQLEKYGADLSGLPDNLILSVFRPSGRVPFGENIIRVVQKGEHKFYRLNKELHDTFQALDLEDSGKLIRFLSAPAQLLRAGVVLEPSFNLANAMRDTFSSAVINKYGAKPFETTIRGLAAMLKNPQLVAEWAASGGKSSVEANFFDRTKLQRYLTERVTKDLTPAERALVIVKSPLTALRWLTGTFEEATRIGEYQIAYDNLVKSGMPEGEARRLAAFEARDRQDFAKGGAKTKIIRHMAAFWNANLQANVKLAQSFKQRPVRTILQGLTYVTTAKLIEQAINWNDSDYWDRQQWERDLFFLIPIGKDDTGHTRFIRVPTPFEVGLIFGTLPGRVLQWAKTNRLEEMADFPAQVLKQTVPNPIPQTLQVVFEDFLSGKKGWDIFRGREIVPERIADLPPELQWTEQTSSTAKLLGRLLHFSPMKIDHIIQSTTGGMGKLLSGRQIPGQRFVTAPLPYSNQASQDFYDILDSLEAEASRNKATGSGGVPENLGYFRSISRQLSQLRNQARQSGDDSEKARLGNKIFQLQKDAIERFRNPQGVQPLNIDTSKLPL